MLVANYSLVLSLPSCIVCCFIGFHDNDILLQGESTDDNVVAVTCALSRII